MESLLYSSLIILLIFLNGFFVAAEFAIVKVRSSQIEQHLQDGRLAARTAMRILANLDAYLSACQAGITLTSLGLGWIGEPFLAEVLGVHVFAPIGILSPALIHSLSFGIAFAIIIYLHIVLGEMAPKSISIRLAEKTTLLVAVPLDLFYKLFKPFIAVLNRSAMLFLKLFDVNLAEGSEMALSGEELKLIFANSAKSGHLTGREAEIMENVLALHDKMAKQIMLPRTSVIYLTTAHTFRENLNIIYENQHTRYPLCDGDLDHITGMIHIKDVLTAKMHGEKDLRMADLKRDVIFYPETISLDALFREFQSTKLHMAVLIDEYGGTTGVVTMEDVLEELFGEIYDEFDQPVSLIRQVGRHEYLIDGLCPVKTCEDKLKIKLPQYDVETVGGIVFSLAGHIPKPKNKLVFTGGEFIVEAIDGQRISKIRLLTQHEK